MDFWPPSRQLEKCRRSAWMGPSATIRGTPLESVPFWARCSRSASLKPPARGSPGGRRLGAGQHGKPSCSSISAPLRPFRPACSAPLHRVVRTPESHFTLRVSKRLRRAFAHPCADAHGALKVLATVRRAMAPRRGMSAPRRTATGFASTATATSRARHTDGLIETCNRCARSADRYERLAAWPLGWRPSDRWNA